MDVRIKSLINKHEGRKDSAYQDSLGYWTIGVGHLIDARKGGKLPAHIIDDLLDYDLAVASASLANVAPWARNLDEVRYAVLLDMTFQLGSLKGWPIFLGQVNSGQYEAASENMRKSKWATQVPDRASELAQMMEHGVWPSLS